MLYDQSRYAQAIRELHEELAIDPDCAFSYALLAKCQMMLGHYDGARRAAEKAVGIAPERAFTHSALAWAHYNGDDYAAALAASDETLRLEPNDADYLGLNARIRSAMKDYAAALVSAEEGLANAPHHRACLEIRAWVLYYLDREAEAECAAREALAIWPENASLLQVLGWSLLTVGRHTEAEANFREALRITPGEAGARRGLVNAIEARQPLYATGSKSVKALGAVWLVLREAFPKSDTADGSVQEGTTVTKPKKPMPLWQRAIWIPVILAVLLTIVDAMVWAIGALMVMQSLSKLLLMFRKANRRLLNASERRGAITVGASLFVVVALLAQGLASKPSARFAPTIVAAILTPAAVASARCVAPRRRWGLAFLTLSLAAVGLWNPVLQYVNQRTGWATYNSSSWPAIVFGCAVVIASPLYLYFYDASKSDD